MVLNACLFYKSGYTTVRDLFITVAILQLEIYFITVAILLPQIYFITVATATYFITVATAVSVRDLFYYCYSS